ncbi:LOW QUALITY PROTEIN: hypothetical protein PanWU01x14_245220 [Parasponia andersonii]|uniref:Uncharacterized protein n=1 Tax=Parasponia andersonii TaxID=3476 RepID=A0A2P5BEX2_PARAD|nr:LOW QUALITY PROTEIN: hypothetical protein PanWU01x14_245220 [Parasponia andersonii]
MWAICEHNSSLYINTNPIYLFLYECLYKLLHNVKKTKQRSRSMFNYLLILAQKLEGLDQSGFKPINIKIYTLLLQKNRLKIFPILPNGIRISENCVVKWVLPYQSALLLLYLVFQVVEIHTLCGQCKIVCGYPVKPSNWKNLNENRIFREENYVG